MSSDNLVYFQIFILIFASAIIGGLVSRRFKLPLLLGYIGAGIITGNLFPTVVSGQALAPIADIGVTLLMFSIGIEFSFHRLRHVFRQVISAVVIQLLVCIGIFWMLFSIFALPSLAALYLAIGVSLSSTAIVVKFLSERGEMDTVPGEFSTGWLIIQDFSVVIFIILLSALSGLTKTPDISFQDILLTVLLALFKSGILLAVVIFSGKNIVPGFLNKVAGLKNRELFLLFVIGLIFIFSISTYYLGFSAPLGAFLAGLLIAETTQNHAIFAEIRPLRDIFAVIFFVSVGMSFKVTDLISIWPSLLIMTIAVIFIKWISVLLICKFRGLHPKTAFLVSLSLIPISEFAIILAQSGIKEGVIAGNQFSLLVGLVFTSVFIGVPLLSNSHSLYYRINPDLFKKIPRLGNTSKYQVDFAEGYPIKDHVVICGFGRVGRYIGRALDMSQIPYLVIDYNHSVVSLLKKKRITAIYGDPADYCVLDYAQVDLAKVLVIAIPDRHTQELIIFNAQKLSRHLKIICRTHHEEDQKFLKSLGVSTIIQPEFEAALSISGKLFSEYNIPEPDISGKISRLKIEHGIG